MKNKGKIKEELINELSELRRRIADLEESETKREQEFRALAENAPDIIAKFDKELRHIYVNPAIERATGIPRDSFIGKTNRELGMPENLISLWDKTLRTVFETGQETTIEFDFPTPGGQRYFESRIAPEFAKDGSVESVLVVSRDIAERKRAEKKLQESEEKFRLIATHSPDVVFFQDCDLRYVWIINPAPPFTEEQVIGKTDFDLLSREEAERLAEIKRTILDTGAGARVEIPLIIGGKKYYYNVVYEPTRDHEGRIMGIFGYAHNITERKRAEEALQKAHDELELRVQERTAELALANEGVKAERQRFNDILDMLPAYLVLLSPDYHVPFANRFFRERFGESHGFRCFEYLFKRREPCEICETYTVLKTMTPHHWEWTGPDGRNYDIFDFPFTDTDGSNLIMEVGIDITESKQAEEKIREQAALLDKAQDAIGVRDLEHRLIYWNKGAQRMYVWTAEEAIGKNADGLLYQEESPQLKEAKKSVIKEGEWTGKLHQVTKEGKEIIVESRWTLVRDNEGMPKSILIINTDITGKEKLEAQLLRAQRMESIGTLAGGIAHDLNNMLTPMMMSLQMLKQKHKDEQSQKLLTILEQNSQRSADLIRQVLSFSRGVEGERNPLHVAYVVFEIEKIVKEIFPKNIEIRTDMPIDIWTISGDAIQLHQVIMNLCVNARDAMPDGGILSIIASNFFIDENYARIHTEAKAGSYVVISVSDTGTGIPPKILDRIFEPFFTTKEFGKGTGLGLSTTLAIIKSHGGFVDVESEVGAGTTFRVYLPAIKTEMKNVEERQLELPIGQGELVLVAEDEDSVREVTISTLEEYGYNVLAARDGADAVVLYAQNMDIIKVVLMDMMMPVMDGEASIRAIRKINPDVKVIAVSGLEEKDKLVKIESTRVHTLLPKPYTAERLLKAMHEVLSAK